MTDLLIIIFYSILITGIVFIVKSYKNKNFQEHTDKEKSAYKKNTIIKGIIWSVFVILIGNCIITKIEENASIHNSIALHEKIGVSESTYQYFEKIGISESTYQSFEKIFEQCGINNIIDIYAENFTGEDSLHYLILEGEKKPFDKDANVFCAEIEDNEIKKIIVNSYVIYQDGEIIDNAKNCLKLTYEEKNKLELEVRNNIRAQLLSPDSAKFREFYWGRQSKNKFVASSMVESKNIFGVTLQTYFKVYYDRSKKTYSIEYQ